MAGMIVKYSQNEDEGMERMKKKKNVQMIGGKGW